MFRSWSFLAVLTVLTALACHAKDARTGAGPLQARADVDFRVQIPDVLRLSLLDHPRAIHVTAEDSLRGEVEVSGMRILLVANHRAGFALQAALTGGFTEAAIEGMAKPLHIRAGTSALAMGSMVGQPRPLAQAVRYRFRFPPGLPPGDHPWPLALSVARY